MVPFSRFILDHTLVTTGGFELRNFLHANSLSNALGQVPLNFHFTPHNF